MANPEAVMRAAGAPKPPMPMGGGMDDMPPAPTAPKPTEGGGGLDEMVGTLQGVGQFLQSQGPAGQKAMTHFAALLQEMAAMGGQAGPEMPPEQESRRIPADQFPGVQVL